MKPAYEDGWNPSKVAEYLLANPYYVEWYSIEEQPTQWIAADGRLFVMMDDDEARWLATWKFVEDRGRVTRAELLAEFGAPQAD
ncbi:hypothetical protein OKA04_11910 [Luteolibacter flavescens]|uniref:Uncharacterized protein n=1 Tax=Luteolibacter flavescens TaxID=1859460 RepID=A0ABT3FPE4_9BACT|nr:hypothetical protein [Luteolibacter flavescens]MCW1885436.1 hypothetical protein [Luteolibacter flavescens]